MIIENRSRRLEQLLDSVKGKKNIKVLFVCLGNICRSPAAEGLMKEVVSEKGDEKRWTVDSCGIGYWHVGELADPRMRVHARRRGIELTHVCRRICDSDYYDFDVIVGMDDRNLRDLHELAPDCDVEKKIIGAADLLIDYARFDHIPDPYYDGEQGFETVLDLLTEATRNLYDTVNEFMA